MLTDEQRKLVEDNLPLVTYTIKKYYPDFARLPIEYEDLKGYGYYALCNAAETFDTSKGFSFSTHACSVIRGYLSKELRKLRQDKRKVILNKLSLDALHVSPSGAAFRLMDLIPDKRSPVDEAVALKILLIKAFDKIRSMPDGDVLLPILTKQVVRKEAEKAIGVSTQTVNKRLNQCKAIIRSEFAG